MTFKKGDLVMVVRPMPCCGKPGRSMGKVFRVSDLGKINGETECCKKRQNTEVALVEGTDDYWLHQSRLIKINPPSDDTEEVADKELEGAV